MRASLPIVIVTVVLAAGCAQDPDTVRINVGVGLISTTRADRAPDYAALYLPYSQMARIAYVDENRLVSGCPKEDLLDKAFPNESSTQADDRLQLKRHLADLTAAGWRCVAGWFNKIPSGSRTLPAPGLAFYVWRSFSSNVCTVAIAYRGTDFTEFVDWQANLRWLTWFLPLHDQYDSVQESVRQAVDIGIAGCGRRVVRVHMVGHSLGGGLAQAAAYADKRSDYVFAFDSSPVTAFTGVPVDDVFAAQQGLAIDRIYETGEVLQGMRYFLQGFLNPRSCNPRVRLVRFNRWTGSLVNQHSIERLATELRTMTKGPGSLERGDPRRAYGAYKAATCDYLGEPFR